MGIQNLRDFPGGPVVKVHLPKQEVQVLTLVGKVSSHMPHGQKVKHKTEAIM